MARGAPHPRGYVQQNACPLLLLPQDALDCIVSELDHLPYSTQAVARVCRALSNRYQLYSIYLLIRHRIARKGRIDLFLLSGARTGKAGHAPFFISEMTLSPDRSTLSLSIAYPEYTKLDMEKPARSYAFVNTERKEAAMYEEYTSELEDLGEGYFVTETVDVEYWENHPRVDKKEVTRRTPLSWDVERTGVELDWRKDVKGRSIKAQVAVLRKRFPCPECKGNKEKEIDNEWGPTGKRWPELAEFWMEAPIACPQCRGYEQARLDVQEYWNGAFDENDAAGMAEVMGEDWEDEVKKQWDAVPYAERVGGK